MKYYLVRSFNKNATQFLGLRYFRSEMKSHVQFPVIRQYNLLQKDRCISLKFSL